MHSWKVGPGVGARGLEEGKMAVRVQCSSFHFIG